MILPDMLKTLTDNARQFQERLTEWQAAMAKGQEEAMEEARQWPCRASGSRCRRPGRTSLPPCRSRARRCAPRPCPPRAAPAAAHSPIGPRPMPRRWSPSPKRCRANPPRRSPPRPRRGARVARLPVGLAVPVRLPVPRWALTPPFHPYPSGDGRSVLCGAIPGVAPAGRYPAPSPHGVRTFLDRSPCRGHPALRAPPVWDAARGASRGRRPKKPRDGAAVVGRLRARGPGTVAQAERIQSCRHVGITQGGQALRQHRIRVGRRMSPDPRPPRPPSQSAGRGRSCGPAPGRNGRSRRRARWTSGP